MAGTLGCLQAWVCCDREPRGGLSGTFVGMAVIMAFLWVGLEAVSWETLGRVGLLCGTAWARGPWSGEGLSAAGPGSTPLGALDSNR